MLPKIPSILSDKGITSTSAQYLSNLANLKVQELSSVLAGVSFINTNVKLGGEEKEIATEVGVNEEFLEAIQTYLQTIGDLTAFISYVREAMKAKADLVNMAKTLSINNFIEEYPEYAHLNAPYKLPQNFTFDDALNELNVAERARYYSLEAKASVIGKYIHKGGAFDRAYKEMLKILKHPNNVEIDTSGNTYTIERKTLSISTSLCSEAMDKLQALHREVEKELNQMKFELDNKVLETNTNLRNKHLTVAELDKINGQKLLSLYSKYVDSKVKEMSDLKIVIPDKLKDTYNYLNSLK